MHRQGRLTKAKLKKHIIAHLDGSGFWGDLWDGVKTGVGTVAKIAKPVLGMIPHPAAQMASKGLDAFGFGKPRKRRRINPAMKRRGEEISKLMKSEGMTLGEASSYLKSPDK